MTQEPSDNPNFYRRHLPHYRADHVIYFVTWRLHPTNAPLEPHERSIIASALEFFHTSRYWLVAYVIMDDHVHVLVQLSHANKLQSIVHSWKSYSTRQLHQDKVRESRVWQNEYLDRIIRNSHELSDTIQYISTNPQKRWPDSIEYEWLRIYEV